MSEGISLIIKSVNQSSADLKIQCDLDLSVLSLKEKIHNEHLAAPKIVDQKLIYFGQLLSDNISLKSALRHPPENNLYTLHLVYPNQNVPLVKPNIETDGKSPNINHNTMESGGARRRTVGEPNPNEALAQGQNSVNYNTYFSQYNPQMMTDQSQQMVVMQQMYAQYMSSYFNYLQTGNAQQFQPYQGGLPPANQTPMLSQTAARPTAPVVMPVREAGAEPEAVPAPADEPQDVLRNAGNGIFGEVEERRDWLDCVYCVCRFCVLLSIVYFYSNAQRFIFVLAVCFFIFLYQQNVFGVLLNFLVGNGARMEQNGPNDNANRPQQQQEPTPSDERDETQSEESSNGERTPDGVAEASDISNAVEVRDTQHSIMALSWTFLTGFFSSLIPDNIELL